MANGSSKRRPRLTWQRGACRKVNRPSVFVRGNAGEDTVRGVPSEVYTYRQIAV